MVDGYLIETLAYLSAGPFGGFGLFDHGRIVGEQNKDRKTARFLVDWSQNGKGRGERNPLGVYCLTPYVSSIKAAGLRPRIPAASLSTGPATAQATGPATAPATEGKPAR